jgi:diguanylate cyclase (GGDEF)-like protein/PAS domain S-box-containing protein
MLARAAALLLILALAWGIRRAGRFERAARERSAERFRGLIQNASDVIAVVDTRGNVLDVTGAPLQRMLGIDSDALIGRNLAELVSAANRPHVRAALARIATPGAEPRIMEWEVEHRDGHTVHVESIGANMLHVDSVGGIVLTFRDVSERRAMESRLRHQAFHDSLTGLANRALFEDRVRHALARRNAGVAVLFVDVDDFKTINDSLGHAAGDELLTEVAARVRSVLRAGDTAARLGGDEFAVLLEERSGDEAPGRGRGGDGAPDVADRLIDALAEPFGVDGRMLTVGASVGVAAAAETGADAASLLRAADIAMYAAKESGKRGWVQFRAEMLSAVQERLDLREALRGAIGRGELSLRFQPVVALGDERVVALEALLRWEREDETIGPDRFIALAEENGLIVPIGRWVLHEACAALAVWQRAHPDLRMAVNVSSVQLADESLIADVTSALDRAGIRPADLTLELTESALAAAGAEHRLAALRELGVRVAVDDFGAGYSSLGYLRRLEIDCVKIDRSFVAGVDQHPRDFALVRSIVELAHSLDLQLIAEGIETRGQAERLREAGCRLGQGFLFAAPEPAGEITRHLDGARAGMIPA